jgi:septum formation protein
VKPLILASASPRRQHLLTSLGLYFEVHPSRLPEPAFSSTGLSVTEYPVSMAEEKAGDVQKRKVRGIILAADTAIHLEGEVLGKPSSPDDALETLLRLGGRTHEVITGCCLLDTDSGRKETFFAVTQVTLASYPEAVLRAYIASGEPADKAGSYAIQGIGSFLVSSIHGSFSNVVGLPLPETVQALLALEAIRCADTRPEQEGFAGPAP